MKAKNISLMIASVFALTLFLAFASASFTLDSTDTMPIIVDAGTNTVTIGLSLENDGMMGGDYSLSWTGTTNAGSLVVPTLATSINNTNQTTSFSINSIPSDFSGTITGNVVASSSISDRTVPFTIIVNPPAYEACEANTNASDLSLSVEIKNEGTGKDDEWNLLDTITVEVEMDNDKGEDIDGDEIDMEDVTFQLFLVKKGEALSSDIAEDMIWLSEDDNEFEFGDVDEGKSAEHIFEFRVNPDEVESDEDYVLLVMAFDDDDNCIDFSSDLDRIYYTEIEIKGAKKSESMIVDVASLPEPLTASCEQRVTMGIDVWNIGDEDFDENGDSVKVTLYNAALGIDLEETIQNTIDAGESQLFTFEFEIPEGMDEKQYILEMKTYYDYDEEDFEYDEESDDTYIAYLKVEGNCALPEAGVSASLEEGGEAGQPLVVRTTITNTGSETTTYTVAANGYSEWAESASLDITTMTLESGQSQDVVVTLDIKKDASGDKLFEIETSAEGEVISTQPIQVSVEGKKSLFTGSLIGDGENSATVAVLLALISAIVIAIVVILIVRAVRNKKK